MMDLGLVVEEAVPVQEAVAVNQGEEIHSCMDHTRQHHHISLAPEQMEVVAEVAEVAAPHGAYRKTAVLFLPSED
jgi:hypothetical protein